MSGEGVTKEDFRDLARELREGQEGIRTEIRSLGSALNAHALEDAEREGKSGRELSTVRAKLESLADSSDDRHRFLRGWLGGLVAVAVAAGLGFLFRSAIDVQISRPSSQPPFQQQPSPSAK
jgi:hypothetical protein